jgi:hypothetical protein
MYAMCCLYRFRSHGRVNNVSICMFPAVVTLRLLQDLRPCSYLQYAVPRHDSCFMLRLLTYVSVHLHTVFDYLNMYRNI